MITTRTVFAILAAVAALSLATTASAGIGYQFVTIGNPFNAPDNTGYGEVDYTYSIGAYDVTNTQYTEFLNAVDPAGTNPHSLYFGSMDSDASNGGITFNSGAANGAKYSVKAGFSLKPVVYVSWFEAARFTNWLSNGQGSGSTETGAYTLNGAMSGIILNNGGGQYWIPTENEWYKAAYYDPNLSGTGGYWKYATRSNSITAGSANYDYNVGHVSDVGAYNFASAYGTYDQSGNAWQWNEAVIGSQRCVRGGDWDAMAQFVESSFRFNKTLTDKFDDVSFRVAAVAILPDTDHDGIPDMYETGTGIYVSPTNTGTSPTNPDTDGDGLTDGQEVNTYHSNPNVKDTDGDGFDDGFEVSTGFDPTSAASTPEGLSSIRAAVEYRFNAANGISYRIEASTDLANWSTIEPNITGTGGTVTRFYSIEGQTKRFFRSRRN